MVGGTRKRETKDVEGIVVARSRKDDDDDGMNQTPASTHRAEKRMKEKR